MKINKSQFLRACTAFIAIAYSVGFEQNASAQSVPASTTFYVSPNGSGSACSSGAPCSLAYVRKTLRNMKTMTKDIDVVLKAGFYDVTDANSVGPNTNGGIYFDQQDSGKNGYTIRYVGENYLNPASDTTDPTATASYITGKQTVSNWSISDQSKNIWVADVNFNGDMFQLYVNKKRAQLARLELNPQIPGAGMLPAGVTYDRATYTYSGVQLPANIDTTRASEIKLIFSVIYKFVRCPLAAMDISNKTVTLDAACGKNMQNSTTVVNNGVGLNWLENSYSFLTQPGQWYFDKPNHKLYYIPRANEDMATSDVSFAKVSRLVTTVNTSNISFQGLVFTHATLANPADASDGGGFQGRGWASGVSIQGGSNIVFSDNTMAHLGAMGLQVSSVALNRTLIPAQNVTIIRNNFYDISAAAIIVGNLVGTTTQKECNDLTVARDKWPANYYPNKISPTTNNNFVISYNSVHDVGAEYLGASGFNIACVNNATISNNTISDLPYIGISAGLGLVDSSFGPKQGPFTIQNNTIVRTMQRIMDGGGIYVQGSGHNSVISGNIIQQTGPMPSLAVNDCLATRRSLKLRFTDSPRVALDHWFGIYLDDRSDRWAVYNNSVSKMVCKGLWRHFPFNWANNRIGVIPGWTKSSPDKQPDSLIKADNIVDVDYPYIHRPGWQNIENNAVISTDPIPVVNVTSVTPY